jgi:aminoglycoside N3'-acetyltransferase
MVMGGDYNDKAERHLYEVEIPDSKEMLKDETQLRFQPKTVREALEKRDC